MDSISNLSIEELESLIEDIVLRILEKQQAQQLPEIKTEEVLSIKKMVTTPELCEELQVSRQTLHNWRKGKYTKNLITPHITKERGMLWYDLEAVKKMIHQNEIAFGKGRDYPYKLATNEAKERKEENRYGNINWKVMRNAPITPEEAIFYREYCEIRGKRNLLDL